MAAYDSYAKNTNEHKRKSDLEFKSKKSFLHSARQEVNEIFLDH